MSTDDARTPPKPLALGLRKALLGPLNVTVAGASAVAAGLMASWPLLALGAAAYAALVAWDLSSQSFWNRVLNPSAPRARLPPARELRDAETRAVVERVHAARAEIARTAAQSADSVIAPLRASLTALDEVDARVARLALRSEELSRYLVEHDPAALAADADAQRERARRTADAATRRSYEEAAAAREEQVRTLGEIAAARERVVADLDRIAATLEGIPGRLVRLGAADADADDRITDDVGRELVQMNVELGAYEETLASLGEAAAAPTRERAGSES
jgi:hypothetical protein